MPVWLHYQVAQDESRALRLIQTKRSYNSDYGCVPSLLVQEIIGHFGSSSASTLSQLGKHVKFKMAAQPVACQKI